MKKAVHFLGIAGSGASAVAGIAKSQGFTVTGCDLTPINEFTGKFKKGEILSGHSSNHLKNIDLLIITPAILSLDPENEELQNAKRIGIPVLTWQQFMGQFLHQNMFLITVCGTHGKSTTTAMIGQILEEAGDDPTVELGANVKKWQGNFRIGKGRYFVTEADEFNDNFLAFHPDISVVTSIEMDHPEYFADFAGYKLSFKRFLSQTKKTIIANFSDKAVKEVIASLDSKLKIIDYSTQKIDFTLKIPGSFNVLNAQAAYQVGRLLNIPPLVIKKSLSTYQGIDRRLEYLGNYKNVLIYSDFGHHPTEIRLTLQALREKYPTENIVVVFQPHMFSRTLALFQEFVQVLRNLPADQTLILDIYPSREVDLGKVSSKQLVEAINKKSVVLLTPEGKVLDWLRHNTKKMDIILFLGAGDTDKLARNLIANSAS